MRATEVDFRTGLREQAEHVERYRRGQLTDAEFRPLRVGYGLYYERPDTSYMQRLKLPGGVLTARQAEAVATIADEYAGGRLHLTTRQNLQLHWIDLAHVATIYERLQAVGLTTRGAAGDSVRAVTCCQHAGLWPGDLFDVAPYARAVHEHFLFHPFNLRLPRKFKVAFASCAADCIQALVNDLAYFPRERDGRRGFSVYAAGGLGAQPFLARPIRDFLPAEDTLIMTEAILRLWHERGERKNRKRARMKYLFQRMHAERFVAAVDAMYAGVEAQAGTALRKAVREMLTAFQLSAPTEPPSAVPHSRDAESAHWLRTNVFAQKQEGYYGVTVQVPLGELTGAQLRAVAAVAREFGARELRATTDQNLMVPWVAGERLQDVHRRLRQIGLAEANALHLTDVTSCPGADYCSLAITRSMQVAGAIRAHLRASDCAVADIGPLRIKISGCPNACGQHHIGDIGLTGLSLKGHDGEPRAHYSLLLGGRTGERTAAIGMRVRARFPESEVPKVIAALAEDYRRRRLRGEHFGDFVQRVGIDDLSTLARTAAGCVR